MSDPLPACDDEMILPPEALPAGVEPVGVILEDGRVVEFAAAPASVH